MLFCVLSPISLTAPKPNLWERLGVGSFGRYSEVDRWGCRGSARVGRGGPPGNPPTSIGAQCSQFGEHWCHGRQVRRGRANTSARISANTGATGAKRVDVGSGSPASTKFSPVAPLFVHVRAWSVDSGSAFRAALSPEFGPRPGVIRVGDEEMATLRSHSLVATRGEGTVVDLCDRPAFSPIGGRGVPSRKKRTRFCAKACALLSGGWG